MQNENELKSNLIHNILQSIIKNKLTTMQNENTNANKKKLIPQELDDLIQEYLTDGIISPKERQVLLNKAKELGLNVDEIDLYIDAQQQKADQAVAAAMNKRRGKTCPYCGSSIPELTDKCPNCGGNVTPEASAGLEEILEKLETALVKFKSGVRAEDGAVVERYVRKARMYYGNNPKIQQILKEIESQAVAAKRKEKKEIGILLFVVLFGLLLFIGWSLYIDYRNGKPKEESALEAVEENEGNKENEEKSDNLSIVRKTAKEVKEALRKGDVDEAAEILTWCEASDLSISSQETTIYKSAVSNVVDAYLEKGQKKKAQNLVTTCAMKFWSDSELSELFLKLGSDGNYEFHD